MTDSKSPSDGAVAQPAAQRLAGRLQARAHPGRGAALAVLALLALLPLLDPGLLQNLRARGFDLHHRIAPRSPAPSQVSIVAIDENSLARYGQWPWPRTLIARLVRQIAASEPRALAVDILFSEPDRLSPGKLAQAVPDLPAPLARDLASLPANEVALAAAFRSVPTVLGLGFGAAIDAAAASSASERGPMRVTQVRESGADPRPFLIELPELLRSLPELTAAERGRGAMIPAAEDGSGTLRCVPLFVVSQHNLVPTLALEGLRVAFGAASLGITTADDGIQGATLGDVFVATDRRGCAHPHFSKSAESRYVSAAELLDEKPFDPARLRGKLVFLGVTGQGLVDSWQTPLGLMHGVEVQAQLAETILARDILRHPSNLRVVEISWVLGVGLLTIFALPYRRPRIACSGFAALVALTLGAAFVSFSLYNLMLDGVYPVIASGVTFGVMLVASLRAAEAARRSLTAELERERELQARLEGELNAARAIQMGMLPHLFPGSPERRDVDVFALIEPARTVGGDLYDFTLLDAERMSFAIADVSGKGVPAALLMVMTKEVLRDSTARHGTALDRVFVEANAKIATAGGDILGEGATMMFVTVFAGVLDLTSGMLAYASAGHDAPFVLRRGSQAFQLGGKGGPPLGTVDDFPYRLEHRQLSPGDVLLLYTDGVTEAEDVGRSFYSTARLERLVASSPAGDARSVVEYVREDVRRFAAGAEQTDDITLLAIRWLGPQTTAA